MSLLLPELERFRTREREAVTCRVVGVQGVSGGDVMFERPAAVFRAPLHELLYLYFRLRKRRESWWRRLFWQAGLEERWTLMELERVLGKDEPDIRFTGSIAIRWTSLE